MCDWDNIVGVAEIAKRTGRKPDTVLKWRIRHDDFPAPRLKLEACDLWYWPDVKAWVEVPRPPGRPPATPQPERGF